MCHPLNGQELIVGVDDPVWVYVSQLDSLPDLELPALGPGPGDRKHDGQGVPEVLRVLFSGEVSGHAVSVQVGSDLRLM